MVGNAWEWTSDWWTRYHSVEEAQNPVSIGAPQARASAPAAVTARVSKALCELLTGPGTAPLSACGSTECMSLNGALCNVGNPQARKLDPSVMDNQLHSSLLPC